MTTISDAHEMMRRPEAALAPGYGVAAAPEEAGITFADITRVLKERRMLLLVTFVSLYALVVAVTLAVWKWVPAYSATALLQLQPPAESAFQPTEPLVAPSIMSLLLQTEAQRIKRPDVLQEVLGLPEIKATSFYKWYDTFEEAVEGLSDELRVSPIPDTQLIMVSLACRDRDEAVLIVRTLVERYVQRYMQENELRSRTSLEELKNTRDAVRKELTEKQNELARFRAQTDVGALEAESMMLAQAISDQMYLVNTYDARATELQAQLNAIRGIEPTDLPITPEDRVIVEADPLLRLYRQQVEALDIQIEATLKTVSGENSRTVKMLRSQREGYQRLEQARREELLDDLRERRVQSLKEELTRVRAVQARVQEQLEEMEARQADLDRARVRYETMVKDEERLLKSLELIEEKVLELQHMAAAAPRASRLTIVQRPKRAVWPSRPNFVLYLGGGLVLSLAGALGLVFLREMTDKQVRTPIDVARYGHLSVLGCVPSLEDEEVELEQIELATRQAPHSLVAEAFRQVRATLVFSAPRESQRVLLVTSPGPGNGKTTSAVNLAVTLAQANERVLLVDANFRRPALARLFPGTRAEGLSNVLIGQARLQDVVVETDVPNLWVMTSGPMPPTPAELLGSQYMRELIEQARGQYDRVIFDGPPVLLVSDALVMATLVDAVLLVARAAENTKGALRRAREQLQKVNARILGAVLNGVRARPGGYYREQYREFYEYGAEETIPPELPAGPAGQPPGTGQAD
jgi:succinoglycan biosynthesis transport protein ExoP